MYFSYISRKHCWFVRVHAARTYPTQLPLQRQQQLLLYNKLTLYYYCFAFLYLLSVYKDQALQRPTVWILPVCSLRYSYDMITTLSLLCLRISTRDNECGVFPMRTFIVPSQTSLHKGGESGLQELPQAHSSACLYRRTRTEIGLIGVVSVCSV